MKEATVTIKFTLRTDDDVSDPPTYFRQAGESIIDSIPKEWWEVTEESLHIVEADVSDVEGV